jgi:hypothetical protein
MSDNKQAATKPEPDEIHFGGEHIAHVARYGNELHISLGNGLEFNPKFPETEFAKKVAAQLRHAMDNKRVVSMGKGTK